VDEGAKLVDTTGKAFSKVATSTGKIGELVAEISSASQEQAQGIEQINKAAAEMDAVTQKTAATAEESASASEELNVQAHRMKGSVEELIILIRGEATNSMEPNTRRAGPAPQKAMTSNGNGRSEVPAERTGSSRFQRLLGRRGHAEGVGSTSEAHDGF
jgi:methyl-accepting chemotaxis protein